ncbi:MAG: iron donor protein CyaY [Pseudomonadota bacterium]
MTEAEYNERIEATFADLETALDEIESDLDYDITGGILTVEFDNGTSMVFSRQPPSRELWLAARAGGFHFAWDDSEGDWRDTRGGELLRPFVVAQMASQADVALEW